MTTYQYTCPQDGDFELQRPMAESDKPTRCPVCKGKAKRVYAFPAVIYKGTGFYTIDSGQRFRSQIKSDSGKQSYDRARAEGKV